MFHLTSIILVFLHHLDAPLFLNKLYKFKTYIYHIHISELEILGCQICVLF